MVREMKEDPMERSDRGGSYADRGGVFLGRGEVRGGGTLLPFTFHSRLIRFNR